MSAAISRLCLTGRQLAGANRMGQVWRIAPTAAKDTTRAAMIDMFTLLLVHGLLLVALYRLMGDERLDAEETAVPLPDERSGE